VCSARSQSRWKVAPDFISTGQSTPARSINRSTSLPVLSRQKCIALLMPWWRRYFRYSATSRFSNSAPRSGWLAIWRSSLMPIS